MNYAGKEYPKNIATMIDSALEYVNGASHLSDEEAFRLIEDWIDGTFGPDGDRGYYPLESWEDRNAAIIAAEEIYFNA